jgi:hypothetical protein
MNGKLKFLVRLLAPAIFAVFMVVLLNNCTNKNPVESTDNDSDDNDNRIVGNIIQTEASAQVYLTQGRTLDSTSADAADGQFEFSNVQSGNYMLKIAASDYDTFYINVTIEEGKAIYVGAVYLAEKSPFDDSIPSVYDHYPKDKAEIIFNPYTYYTGKDPQPLYISISFDRPMDRETVKQALSIDPPLEGYYVWSQNKQTYNPPSPYNDAYRWDGMVLADAAEAGYAPPPAPAEITTYSKVQSFTFYFNMSDCYTDTTYTIKLSQEATDTGGVPLDSALEYSFSTVQSATAYDDVMMDPHDNEDYVDLFRSQGIQITFPNRMDQPSVESHISMTPNDTDAILLWHDYNKLVIITSGRILIPDTTYVITIDSAALDAGGTPLGETKVLSFSTRGIQVKSTVPAHGDMMVEPWDTLQVQFNTYMDKNSFIGKMFLVSGSGDTIQPSSIDYYHYTRYGTTTWHKDKIMFDPAVLLDYDEKYTLYISPGVTDRLGYPMKQGYQLVFVTMP